MKFENKPAAEFKLVLTFASQTVFNVRSELNYFQIHRDGWLTTSPKNAANLWVAVQSTQPVESYQKFLDPTG